MNTPISPAEFKNAKYCIDQLKPALDAIQKISRQAVGYDDGIFGKVEEFKKFLSQVHAGYQSVVDQGNLQHQNRDENLINRAAMRLNNIPRCIEKIKIDFDLKTRACQYKRAELEEKGFSVFEINQIVKPIGQGEIDNLNTSIEALREEGKALKVFLADSPRFDKELLRDTTVYPSEADLKSA